MKKTLTVILASFIGTAFAQVTSQSFAVSGNFVVPQGVTTVTVTVIGSGGNGASNGGGGGGGGGAATGIYPVTPGVSIPVTIGVAGGGAITGVSSFSNFISATGGDNGNTVPNPAIGGGGNGGSGSGGVVNWSGGNGGGGYWTYFGGGGGGAAGPLANGSAGGNTIAWTGICLTPGGAAGASGGAPGGAGGKGAGFTDPNCNISDPATNGLSYGGGGGGGNGNGGAPGVGADGYCMVLYNGCAAPAAPSNATPAGNLTICMSNTTTLIVVPTGTINWYTTPNSPNSIGTGANFVVSPTLTTTYYAEASNACNTSTRTAITVTVNPTPTLTAVSSQTAVCPFYPATLTVSGASTYTWNTTQNTSTVLIAPGTTTTYTVGGNLGGNNCVGTTTITQLVSPNPTLSISSSIATVCIGQTASITVSGAATYSWNTSSTTSVIAVSPLITTLYSVVGKSADNCADTISIQVYVKMCETGISILEKDKTGITVYPNPSHGELTIAATENLKLSLVDQLGRVIETITLDETNEHRVFVKKLATGIYFITGAPNRPDINRKIIISD